MDQTAPADQSILRDQRERSEDANLDRRVRLCPRRHRPEASRAGRQPLPNSTDLERDAIRENAHFTGPSGLRLRRRFTRRQQPIDSIRLLAGQQCAHVLVRLEVSDLEFLFGLTVFRKAFPSEAIRCFLTPHDDGHTVRARLVDNFLLKHDRGRDTLEKIAREVGAGFLGRTSQKLKGAHSIAGDLYARHFRARRMVGGGRLGGDFVEARFHLVQAGRQDEVGEIVSAFERHIRTEITPTSPVPKDPRALDERIAVLSALLGEEGAKGLEYHLARCLSTRGRPLDGERALTHVRRALGPQAPVDTWVLAGRLASQIEGCDSGIAILREGLNVIHSSGNLFSLYQSCAELMAREKRTEEAIELLREGIAKVPAKLNGYRLAEAALYFAASLGNHAVIQQLVTASGGLALGTEQKALGTVLLLQLDDEWIRAAEQARRGLDHRPRYIALCEMQAFSWLAAGNPEEAQAALNRFSLPIKHGRGSPITWLASFVARRCGRHKEARQLYAQYVGKDEL